MLKFRTMRPDAERLTGAVLAGERDQRVTRIGRFLRKVRLDEVPQLLNVLRGEMSIVGPRPERPELFADLVRAIPYFEERVRGLKPGITGLAQVSLGYAGKPFPGSDAEKFMGQLTNPFALEETAGAVADEPPALLHFAFPPPRSRLQCRPVAPDQQTRATLTHWGDKT
jgi:hypothetical protein